MISPIALISIGFVFTFNTLGQECRWPNGEPIPTTDPGTGLYEVACNASLSTSACCNPNSLCTSSGLCIGTAGHWYRGGCTDPDFPAPCSDLCYDPNDGDYTNIYYCGSGSGGALWCCGTGDTFCCDDESNQFYENDAWAGYWFKPDGASSSAVGLAAWSTSGAVQSSKTSPGSVGTTESNASKTTQGSAASTKSVPSSNEGGSTSSDLGIPIGVGVGVPLGLLALGIVAFLFWREKRKGGKLQQRWQAEVEKTYSSPAQPYLKAASATGVHEVLGHDWHELGDRPPRELDAQQR